MYQLLMKFHLQDGTESTVFVPEVAKQHDIKLFAVAGWRDYFWSTCECSR